MKKTKNVRQQLLLRWLSLYRAVWAKFFRLIGIELELETEVESALIIVMFLLLFAAHAGSLKSVHPSPFVLSRVAPLPFASTFSVLDYAIYFRFTPIFEVPLNSRAWERRQRWWRQRCKIFRREGYTGCQGRWGGGAPGLPSNAMSPNSRVIEWDRSHLRDHW